MVYQFVSAGEAESGELQEGGLHIIIIVPFLKGYVKHYLAWKPLLLSVLFGYQQH